MGVWTQAIMNKFREEVPLGLVLQNYRSPIGMSVSCGPLAWNGNPVMPESTRALVGHC